MNNKEIFEAYKLINSNSETSHILSSLENVLSYLNALCNQINSKGFKSSFIYQWTFKTEIDNNKDYECYLKANLCSAANSLKRVISKIGDDGITNVRSRLIKDFLCDLKPFISYYDKEQDYSWLIINTNTHISNFYYDLAEHAFWNGEPSEHPEERLAFSTSAPFIIRQAIEYKVKRVLAIDYILQNDKPYLRTTELCFKIIDKCSNLLRLKDFSFETIKNIYSWTHSYIHGGYRPAPWKTECALNYLKLIYYSGETSNQMSYSMYAGIEVYESDLSKMKEITDSLINKEKNLTVRWLSQPEVAVIKE